MTTLFSRGSASFAVVGDRRVVADVAALLDPFVSGREVAPDAAARHGWWTLYLSADDAPADVTTATVEVPSKLDEPSVRFAVARRDRWVAPCSTSTPLPSLDACRVVRGFLRAETARRAMLCVHGGMVGIGGAGIAVIGPKRSGKTSVLLALMLHRSASFVANDDLMIDGGSEPIVGLGWPRTITVRPGTRAALAAGAPALAMSTQALSHPMNRASYSNVEDRDSAYFLPSELAAACGAGVEPSLAVRAVVFPGWGTATAVQALAPPDAAARLLATLDDEPSRYAAWVGAALGVMPRPSQAAALVCRVAEVVPCFELTQNLDRLAEASGTVVRALATSGAVDR